MDPLDVYLLVLDIGFEYGCYTLRPEEVGTHHPEKLRGAVCAVPFLD